jgi:hypothetical protein
MSAQECREYARSTQDKECELTFQNLAARWLELAELLEGGGRTKPTMQARTSERGVLPQ